jgi:predicted DNA-binding protein
MATTGIRIPDDHKDRIARAAARIGETTNAFMLAAIAEHVSAEERRYAQSIEDGQTIPWSAMRSYLKRRMAGDTPERPAPAQLGDDS